MPRFSPPEAPPAPPATDRARPDALRDRLRRAARRALRGGEEGPWRVVRVALPLGAAPDPLAWLAAQPFAEKAYWHGRGDEGALAACGAADACADVEALGLRLAALARAEDAESRYLGGMRFSPAAGPAPEWAPFGAARFVLPRFELRAEGGAATLAVNLVLPHDARHPAALEADLAALRPEAAAAFGALPLPVAREDAPGRAGWGAGLAGALAAFEVGGLEKVVLARRAAYAFEEALDPFALTRRLEDATPSCFHFVFQPAKGVAFVGATPERLFRREGARLWTEAVAGTRPRSADPARDAALRAALLASEKDRREHAYVRDQILRALGPYCAACDADRTAAMPLASKWHLRAAVRGGLRPEVGTLDLLAALHPTPAVGGTPTGAALARIAATEPFDRGWYAGPVGWVGAEAAEFAVAIRSGLVRQGPEGASLALYSGAGIVAGSDPAAEWAEIEDKIVDFARVLGLEG